MQSSSTPSLSQLQGFKERAKASFQASSEMLKEHIDLAKQSAEDRVMTARGGKKLLDEGGESFEQTLLAKGSSLVASDVDRSIAARVHVAIIKLDDSVSKLNAIGSAQHTEESTGNDNFCQLADEHQARVAAYRRIAEMLESPASCAELSPEESDALAIVRAKSDCSTLMSKTAESLKIIRQRALTSMTTASAEQGIQGEHGPEVSSAVGQQPTLLQGLHDRAKSGLQKVQQVANDRVETARAAKRLLEAGGESVAHVVVAKKACVDAADVDRDIAQRMQCAIALFDDSAAKLHAVKLWQEAAVMPEHGDLVRLAEEHELRADMYRQIAGMLEAPIRSAEMNLAEWDALSLVKIRHSCGTLQYRTHEGFEAVKGMVYSGCASEADRFGKKLKTACA